MRVPQTCKLQEPCLESCLRHSISYRPRSRSSKLRLPRTSMGLNSQNNGANSHIVTSLDIVCSLSALAVWLSAICRLEAVDIHLQYAFGAAPEEMAYELLGRRAGRYSTLVTAVSATAETNKPAAMLDPPAQKLSFTRFTDPSCLCWNRFMQYVVHLSCTTALQMI